MRKRIKREKAPIATSSQSGVKQLMSYHRRKHHYDVLSMKDEQPKYYVKFLGELKEISPSEIEKYQAGGFEIITE